jgi:HAD superfamily hydrolase (TIGR01450 family)
MALFSRSRRTRTPLDDVDTVLADLDGVVYAGSGELPHAVASLMRASDEGARLGYITNNASRTDADVAAHLRDLGLTRTAPEDVVTSPQAAVRLLRTKVPPPAVILVVGGKGLLTEVARAGYTVTDSADADPAAVVQGFSPDIVWTQLAEAAFALKVPEDDGGIPWIATNTDWTLPQERGMAPGNGTLVSAVHTATGRLATVAGKPEPPIFHEAVARFEAQNPLFIGDRLDTDIAGAQAAGIPSALVLTGVDRPKHLLAAPSTSRPTFILEDLRQLFEPYPATRTDGDTTRVGDAIVRVDEVDLKVVDAGSRPIDLVRAGAAAVWNSGRAIFGFRVEEALYADPFFRP